MTLLVTAIGTILNLFMTLFFAYLLSKKDLPKKFTLILCIFYDAFFRRNDSKLYYLVSGI